MRLRDRVGRRGAVLLFFALLDLVYCYGLLNPPQPLNETYAWPATIFPLAVWAACWGGVGVICLVFAFLTRDSVAFAAAVALKIAWGLLSLLGWLSGVLDRGYVTATIWFGFALFVFVIAGGVPPPPGRSREVR